MYYHLVRDRSWIMTAQACVRVASRENDSSIATARFELAALMEEEIESTVAGFEDNQVLNLVYIDLLRPALDAIDWQEIADCFLDDLDDLTDDPSIT